jgi:hypothetical protein
MAAKAHQIKKILAKATVIAMSSPTLFKRQHPRNPKKKQFYFRAN